VSRAHVQTAAVAFNAIKALEYSFECISKLEASRCALTIASSGRGCFRFFRGSGTMLEKDRRHADDLYPVRLVSMEIACKSLRLFQFASHFVCLDVSIHLCLFVCIYRAHVYVSFILSIGLHTRDMQNSIPNSNFMHAERLASRRASRRPTTSCCRNLR